MYLFSVNKIPGTVLDEVVSLTPLIAVFSVSVKDNKELNSCLCTGFKLDKFDG